MENNFGKLYLIPTDLGENPVWDVLPTSITKIIDLIDDYIVEFDGVKYPCVDYGFKRNQDVDIVLRPEDLGKIIEDNPTR